LINSFFHFSHVTGKMSTLEATVDDVSPDVVEYPSSLPILTPIGWFYWTILGIPVIMEHSAPCGNGRIMEANW
jgi:hypothetical protein